MATFKVKLDEDLRRFQLSKESLHWHNLKEEIKSRFGFDASKQFRVKYLDSEGELVNLENEEELVEALSSHGSSAVRLQIFLSSAPSAASKPVQQKSSLLCSGCAQAIAGAHFKCGHCVDFNLCPGCETTSTHPASHIFLYIKNLINPTHPAWLSKSPLLPPLHTEPQTQPQPQPQPQLQPQNPPQPQQITILPPPPSAKPVSAGPSARYVEDVSIPDGSIIRPGKVFTKTWKILNGGNRKWPADTKLRFIRGEQMTNLDAIFVPFASPQQQVDISISLLAPQNPGRYTSIWQLAGEGVHFGPQVWCNIIVAEPGDGESPNGRLPLSLSQESDEDSSICETLPAPNDERYEEEMKQLLSQGFGNRKKNFNILRKHKGDMNLVLKDLQFDLDAGWGSN